MDPCSEDGPGCEKIAIGAGPPETTSAPKGGIEVAFSADGYGVRHATRHGEAWHEDGGASGSGEIALPGVFYFFWQTQNSVARIRNLPKHAPLRHGVVGLRFRDENGRLVAVRFRPRQFRTLANGVLGLAEAAA